MDRPSDFIISESRTRYTIENVKAMDFGNNHTHINKKFRVNKKEKGKRTVAEMLIHFICNKRVPYSPYLRTSAKRIARDENYIQQICNKEEKDADKQKYFNQNMGFR